MLRRRADCGQLLTYIVALLADTRQSPLNNGLSVAGTSPEGHNLCVCGVRVWCARAHGASDLLARGMLSVLSTALSLSSPHRMPATHLYPVTSYVC